MRHASRSSAVLGALWLLAACAAPATAEGALRWAGSFGHTAAIAAIPSDLGAVDPGSVKARDGSTIDWDGLSDRGGRSLRLALLAPVTDRVAVGAEVWTDDLLSLVASERTSVGETVDAQPVLHRSDWGLAWRVDAQAWSFPAVKAWRVPVSHLTATGTAGVWRTTDDRLLRRLAEDDAFGWSLGAGWTFQLPGRVSIGPAFRYARVFNDRIGRYVIGSLDWNWR